VIKKNLVHGLCTILLLYVLIISMGQFRNMNKVDKKHPAAEKNLVNKSAVGV
jgi:hypothetical protein